MRRSLVQGVAFRRAAILACAAIFVFQAAASADSEPAREAVAAASSERSRFGLRSDGTYVSWLLQSGADVGTTKWGIPLTATEEDLLDLPGRMQFVNEVSESLLPFAESLPSYAGAFVDQANNGDIVILLTA